MAPCGRSRCGGCSEGSDERRRAVGRTVNDLDGLGEALGERLLDDQMQPGPQHLVGNMQPRSTSPAAAAPPPFYGLKVLSCAS